MSTLVHLVYIHGFQGNDTTFQSFPKHLQEHLAARIPAHLDIKIQSSLYPTYKSVKPISHATKNFLEWLSTQPSGPVILLGHSMGGLLAADAATDPSNNPENHPGAKPKRIIGVIAFDTPYLGMHPHVIVSGIASLFPKDDDEKKEGKSESAMNEHPQVNIIDEKVTDDWEAFKTNEHIHPKHAPYAPDSPSVQSSTSQDTFLSPKPSIQSTSSTPSRNLSPSPFTERAFSYLLDNVDHPVVRWVRKHSDEPLAAGKRWVTERFQFGICMFDPPGLKARYERLVEWQGQGGKWVNYWTQTVHPTLAPRSYEGEDARSHHTPSNLEQLDNGQALRANGIIQTSSSEIGNPHQDISDKAATASESIHSEVSPEPPVHTAPTKSEAKANQKQAERQVKEEQKQLKRNEKAKAKALKQEEKNSKPKSGRHFVTLPNGLGQVLGGLERWENVPIGGVNDEVNAHLGLFIPHHNLDYAGLTERVANTVLGWCEDLPGRKDGR